MMEATDTADTAILLSDCTASHTRKTSICILMINKNSNVSLQTVNIELSTQQNIRALNLRDVNKQRSSAIFVYIRKTND